MVQIAFVLSALIQHNLLRISLFPQHTCKGNRVKKKSSCGSFPAAFPSPPQAHIPHPSNIPLLPRLFHSLPPQYCEAISFYRDQNQFQYKSQLTEKQISGPSAVTHLDQEEPTAGSLANCWPEVIPTGQSTQGNIL